MTLTPVSTEPAATACPQCGAALVADQRYCLTCGHAVSPTRLAFLDVLQSEHAAQPSASWPLPVNGASVLAPPAGYAPVLELSGTPGWLRRYSGVLALLSVLLLAMTIGLLVGHWVTQGGAPSHQVVEVKGLGGAPLAAASTTPTSSGASGATGTNAKQEAEEAKEAAKETAAEKAPPPPPVKVSPTTLKKIGSTTGKQHQEEVNKLGNQPIETGGGGSTPAPSSKESNKPIGGGSKVEAIE